MDLQLDSHRIAMERLYNSRGYHVLERQLSQSNPQFRNLEPSARLVATYLLQAHDYSMADLWRLFYKRRPPTITEFLTDAYLPQSNQILYPKWRELLTQLYSPGSTYYELVVGGAIGGGKSFFVILAHVYNLIRVACLLNPHAVLGSAPNKALILSLFTITLPKAKKALIEPFRESLVEITSIFEPVLDRREWKAGFPSFANSDKVPFYDNNDEICLPNNVAIMMGSRSSHALSFDMFGAMLDEAEFRNSEGGSMEGVDAAFEVYSNLKERIDSRFLDSRFKLCALVSSARYDTGIMAAYGQSISDDSPTTIKASFPIWEIKSFASYADGHFWVLRGTSAHPSRILSEAESLVADEGQFVVPQSCRLLRVPKVYRDKFEFRIEEAIRNLAGVQTIGADHPFPDTSTIEDPLLVPECQLVAELGRGTALISQLPRQLFAGTGPQARLARHPSLPRYLHVDLATVNVAGVTMLHKELRQDLTVEVVDFTAWITSPTRIDLDAIERLIIDLHQLTGVYFRVVSADQFQSDSMRQKWELSGVADQVLLTSVDRTILPYSEAARMVASGRFRAGPCPNLRMQMAQVALQPHKRSEKVKRGPAGKDQLDSVVGALVNSIEDVQYPAVAQYIEVPLAQHRSARASQLFAGADMVSM